jgi:hypothetical protein
VVSYEQCGREYFTISNSGVSYYRPGEEVEFTPLENFAKEYHRYTRLIKVKYLSSIISAKEYNHISFRSKPFQRSGNIVFS